MGKRINYTYGDKVGMCIFVEDAEKKGKHRYATFLCSNCGSQFVARISHVKAGLISTCTCTNNRDYHGESNTPLYHVWEAMKQRCDNNDHQSFKYYGERSITYTQNWASFINFKRWAMSSGYDDTLTLERIDVNGDYTESNCTWVSRSTQMANRRFTSLTEGYGGIEKTPTSYRVRIKYNNQRFHIGVFPTALEAAIARDKYIVDNNLPHMRNFTDEELYQHLLDYCKDQS